MKAKFIERYDKLSEMNIGNIAVSADRSKIFICCHAYDIESACTRKVIINLNDLHGQYCDKWDMNQQIKKLVKGDKFLIEL